MDSHRHPALYADLRRREAALNHRYPRRRRGGDASSPGRDGDRTARAGAGPARARAGVIRALLRYARGWVIRAAASPGDVPSRHDPARA